MKFPKEFLLGASTAAHQVEGNNRYSDLWAQEQMEHSSFAEPSNDAVEAFFHRWQMLGFEPAEWVATQDHGPGERVR